MLPATVTQGKEEMNQPLTDEQIWGIPTTDMPDKSVYEVPADFCLIRQLYCQWWDGECVAESCVFDQGPSGCNG